MIDLIGKRRYAYILSATLTVIAVVFILATLIPNGNVGLQFSIAYTGGTVWEVHFQDGTPDPNDVRAVLDDVGLTGEVAITEANDLEYVLIRTEGLSLQAPDLAEGSAAAALAAEQAAASAQPETSLEPGASASPEASEAPAETASPEASEAPAETGSPEASEAPAETSAPVETTELDASAAPEASAEPEASAAPEASVRPEASSEASMAPEAPAAAEASVAPEASAAAEASTDPAASAEPDASAAPEASTTPEASAEPESSPAAGEAAITPADGEDGGSAPILPTEGTFGELATALQAEFGPIDEVRQENSVGPVVSQELIYQTFLLVLMAAAAIMVWVAYRFRDFRMGVTALVALLHDVVITVGAFAVLGTVIGLQIDSLFVTAMLTVIGYSVHDTIVVFDRIRENRQRFLGEPLDLIVNHSLVQTVGRSLTTSFTLVLTMLALLLFGGEAIRPFTLALLIGVVAGTYSSIFVATSLFLDWHRWADKRKAEQAPRAKAQSIRA